MSDISNVGAGISEDDGKSVILTQEDRSYLA
jgi:hypothetical protein